MIAKYFAKNVSETHDFNNPTQGTQCGVSKKILEIGVSERRDFWLGKKMAIKIGII